MNKKQLYENILRNASRNIKKKSLYESNVIKTVDLSKWITKSNSQWFDDRFEKLDQLDFNKNVIGIILEYDVIIEKYDNYYVDNEINTKRYETFISLDDYIVNWNGGGSFSANNIGREAAETIDTYNIRKELESKFDKDIDLIDWYWAVLKPGIKPLGLLHHNVKRLTENEYFDEPYIDENSLKGRNFVLVVPINNSFKYFINNYEDKMVVTRYGNPTAFIIPTKEYRKISQNWTSKDIDVYELKNYDNIDNFAADYATSYISIEDLEKYRIN